MAQECTQLRGSGQASASVGSVGRGIRCHPKISESAQVVLARGRVTVNDRGASRDQQSSLQVDSLDRVVLQRCRQQRFRRGLARLDDAEAVSAESLRRRWIEPSELIDDVGHVVPFVSA